MLRIGICDDNREDIARIRELAVRFSEEHPRNAGADTGLRPAV